MAGSVTLSAPLSASGTFTVQPDSVTLSSPFSSSGTFTVQGAIYAKWVALAEEKAAGGVQDVQSYLGYPLGEGQGLHDRAPIR